MSQVTGPALLTQGKTGGDQLKAKAGMEIRRGGTSGSQGSLPAQLPETHSAAKGL